MDELKQILHQRGQSNVSSQNNTVEVNADNKELNTERPIEFDLDPSIQVDEAFLASLSEQ